MIPASLSASSVQTLEACLARWIEENIRRAPQPSSNAADVGTCVHYACEKFVERGYHLDAKKHWHELEGFYTEKYEELFDDPEFYGDGLALLHTWWERTEWTDRTVLSTEQKNFFMIKASGHEVKFNYIWDRCDLVDGPHSEKGETWIEVVDYKTLRKPIQPQELRHKIQARCYGVAAQIAYPQADRIWITFDMLRFEPVSTVFTREDNIATYRYLQRVLRRVLAIPDDVDLAELETLNENCNWCVRKQVCEALTKHEAAGGFIGISDPAEMAARRFLLENRQKGTKAAIEELDKLILAWCEQEDKTEFSTDLLDVAITARRSRTLDSERAMTVVGAELISEYGSLGVTAVDRLLKDPRLTEEQRAELKGMIRFKYSEPSVKISSKNPID